MVNRFWQVSLIFSFLFLSHGVCSLSLGISFAKSSQDHSSKKEIWPSPGPKYTWVPGWIKDSNMSVLRGSAAVLAVNGHVYAIGGGGFRNGQSIIHASVEYAPIQPDGSLGSWSLTSPLKTRRVFAAAVSVNGFIYVLGGEKGYEKDELLETVEKAQILPDGSLGEWNIESYTMNTPRRGLAVTSYKGHIYAFGGFNGVFLNDVERTEVLPDGSLSEWQFEQQESTSERYVHTGLIHKNHVYLFGGHVRASVIGTETAEWASINQNGSVGKWTPIKSMLTKRLGGEAFAFNDNVYIVGGHNTIPLSSVERATILPDGTLEEWKRDTPLTDARVGAGIGVSNNVVYVVGGSNEGEYLRSVLRAYFVEGKPLGYWADDMQLATNAVFKRASVPLDAKNHFEKGWIFFMEKQYENSALEYELGIQIIPDFPQPYNMLGTALHNGKMFQKAIEAYGKAIKLEPGFGPFYFNKGNSHLALNQKVEAEAMFRKAMQLSPGFLNAKVRLFQLLSKEGRCAEIIAPLQELTSSYPENEFLKKISTRCM